MKLRKMKHSLAGFSVIATMGISLFSAGTAVLPVKATELEETVTTEEAVATSEEASAESQAETATTEEAVATSEETATGEVVENTTEVAIDETNFPDSAFRSCVMQFDTDGNGSFSSDELLAVTTIVVDFKKIASLKGVEYFTALIVLSCDGNRLTSLDVSKNTALIELDCSQNELTSLDVSKNTALRWLDCSYNYLTGLDVSNNTKLEYLKDKPQYSKTPDAVVVKPQPDANESDANQPAVNEPDANQPIVNEPDVSQPNVNQTTVKAETSPKTGDAAPIIPIVCMFFLSLAGIITLKRKGAKI